MSPDAQPTLPLQRSFHCHQQIDGMTPATEEQSQFAKQFNQFCDKWQINGMVSWELPDVAGPKWPELQPNPLGLTGRVTYDMPWHFPLLAEDGLGEFARQEHEALAQEMSVDDQGSWRSYAQMFLVGFWEGVIRSRYTERRPRGFVTAMTAYIADIVGLDMERIKRLRKWRSAMLRGDLSSLAGKR